MKRRMLLLGLCVLLLMMPVYAENETEETVSDSEAYTQTFALATQKAIVQAEEIISRIESQGNDTTQLQSILDELIALNGTEVSSREEYKELRDEAKNLVSEFRALARTYVPESERDALRERVKERAKERIQQAKERVEELRERFNEKQLGKVSERVRAIVGDKLNMSEFRKVLIAENITKEELRERVKAHVQAFVENRQEIRERIQERMNETRERMERENLSRSDIREEIAEDARERAQEIKAKAEDLNARAEELKQQYEAGEITLEEFNKELAKLRREGFKDILGDGPLGEYVADVADEYQREFENEMDSDGNGEISEEEAMGMMEDYGVEVPAR